MAEDESRGSCLAGAVWIIFWYLISLDLLSQKGGLRWWHFLAAAGLAIGFGLLIAAIPSITKFLVTWVAVPAAAVAVSIGLGRSSLDLWISVAGAGFVIFGITCARLAVRRESRPLAINALTGCIAGLIMVVVGLVRSFL